MPLTLIVKKKFKKKKQKNKKKNKKKKQQQQQKMIVKIWWANFTVATLLKENWICWNKVHFSVLVDSPAVQPDLS